VAPGCLCAVLVLLPEPSCIHAALFSLHMQEVAKVKKNGLLTFLAWWHEWASRASPGALTGGDASEVFKRQEGPPLQQPPRRDKTPCKNFFWKTFSSCK
uniref:Cortistatin n=1 Tax=Sciurus vulgaris TaxID=55149 RepID=A0A8D2AZ07_SCIVU